MRVQAVRVHEWGELPLPSLSILLTAAGVENGVGCLGRRVRECNATVASQPNNQPQPAPFPL